MPIFMVMAQQLLINDSERQGGVEIEGGVKDVSFS